LYLKKIEIHGFKSFADEIKLEFEPNITAILGPNGSGKSNIADAIRWVLGEQSAKSLRGSTMEDVIFAGSNQRKALGIAEVKLTLDNSNQELPIDYSEVTIGRRVSRSGESDYLLNNSICRLKDIEELIMGTGMGKEAYSIIGQGKVDTILSSKSTDRREIFEEAAGITKHKKRKSKATKKLEETERNLQRITDIIKELEKQIGPLEEEAKKAKNYNRYYDELKDLEVNLLLNKYKEMDDERIEVSKNRNELERESKKIKDKVADYDSKMEDFNFKLEQITEKINLNKDNTYQTEKEIERINNKIQILEEKRSNADYRLKQLKKEIEIIETKTNDLKSEKKKNKEDLEEVEKKLAQKQSYLEVKEEELDSIVGNLKEKEGSRSDAKESMIEHLNQINKKRNHLDNIKRQIIDIEEEMIEKEEEKEENESCFTELKKELKEVEEEILETKRKFKTKQREVTKKEEKKIELQEGLEKLHDKYDELKSKENNYRSKLEVLKDMQKKYQGYYRGVKNVLQHRENNPDFAKIHGVVAELLTAPKKYETAIEVAMGSRLQNIVVAGDRDAKAAINYLKESKSGRATFLPLNLIDPRSLRSKEKEALKLSGALGVAADLVNYEEKYAPVMKNLLGRIIIAKDIDAAVAISKRSNKRVKVVTLEGEIINPGGSMTGGSSHNNNANLLSRSRQIEELEVKVNKLDEKLQMIEDKGINIKNKLVNMEEEIKKEKDLIHQLDLDLTGRRKDYQQLEKEIDRLEILGQQINNYSTALGKELASLQEERENLAKELNLLTNGNQNIEGAISSIEDEIKEIESKKEEYNQQVTEVKVDIASIKQEKVNLEEAKERLESNIRIENENIAEKKSEIKELNDKKAKVANSRADLLDGKEKKEEEKEKLKVELNKLQKKKDEFVSRINKIKEESQGIRNKLNEVQTELNDYEVREAQLKVKLENIEEKLVEKYEVIVAEKIDSRRAIDNYEEVEGRIEELKSQINKLGHVNLGAIEEYETLKERFDFMKEQHTDLIEAKDSLTKIISEVDETMKEKFEKTFSKIKVEFEEVFIKLFDGGQAELNLENPENILETGIEINAQPPGKKLQKLSLMSGGEKSLTAIALIFAILRVRPSPFYVLDEIDAALDEANVDRFADFLQELSSIAQFVLITHRKGTMRIADALYGVTMQESGVSEMVSLKLNEIAS
jgi:chromosome segregation protein